MDNHIDRDLSIVIPAYKEAERIGFTLDQLAEFLATSKKLKDISIEVIVVAAEAGDGTDQIALDKKDKFKYFRLLKPGPKVGKGRDVKFGMLKASGKYILFMDADLATPLHHIETFYDQICSGNDIVIASRGVEKHSSNILRISITAIGNLLYRLLGGLWIDDSQCGFKIFTKEATQLCFSILQIDGWGFDMEILTIAHENKLTIKTIHINDWKPIPNGTFENAIIKNSLVSLKDLFIIFFRRISGQYKKRNNNKG